MSLKIQIFESGRVGKTVAQPQQEALAEGIKKHIPNAKISFHDASEKTDKCDIKTFWGMPKKIGDYGKCMQRQINSHDGPFLVTERGFVKRDKYSLVGVNGINGFAEYNCKNSPDDRWKKLDVNLQEWKDDGDTVVIAGQTPIDCSHSHVNLQKWYRRVYKQIKKKTDNVVFRPHPGRRRERMVRYGSYDRMSSDPPMRDIKIWESDRWVASRLKRKFLSGQDVFKKAKCIVTFSSNIGVDATIAGVPVVSWDRMAMTYDLVDNDLKNINNPSRPDRTQWAHDIAYCQWNIDEIRNGEAWENIWPIVEKKLK